MGFSDSFFKRVEKKTNVKKEGILDIASKLKDGNLKDENTIRGVIEELSKLTGKEVSKEESDRIVNAVIKDKIPNNLESML